MPAQKLGTQGQRDLGRTTWHRVKTSARVSKGADLGYQIETSVPDIARFAGPTREIVQDGLQGFPEQIVIPRRVEPLLELFRVQSAQT